MRGAGGWSTARNCQWPVGVWPQGPQGRTWRGSSLPLHPTPRPGLPCSPHCQNPWDPGPPSRVQRLDWTGSIFLRALSSASGSPLPASQAPNPSKRQGRVPSLSCNPGRSRPWGLCEGARAAGAGGGPQLHHREAPDPQTLNLPSRCPRLGTADILPLTNGPGGPRRPPRDARGVLSSLGVTAAAPRSLTRASHDLSEAGGTFGV